MTDEAPNRIRRAQPDDAARIMTLLDEAIQWLAAQRLDQWQNSVNRQRAHLRTDIGAETVFLVECDEAVVATITVDEFADSDFWKPSDNVKSALYVHRMAVARAKAGMGLGSAMLDWAAARAERCNKAWLRLDAWRTNGGLHVYYKDLGFEMVRNDLVPGRGSGALFQRPVTELHGGGPLLVDASAPLPLN